MFALLFIGYIDIQTGSRSYKIGTRARTHAHKHTHERTQSSSKIRYSDTKENDFFYKIHNTFEE